ncbi:hypothetical protein GCM10028803_22290 [Larkinella knui]|uniref:DUF1508 domain-containing protein n=1 Tax=Larkinella knui TaxID=2025310 RepID=A0A3P1CVJ3_9BACT|nr:DUF1508 domain-containing protein [Larkinella knui]RRB17303.1 DUF1508 domain-containing protein [Larkinella knui]
MTLMYFIIEEAKSPGHYQVRLLTQNHQPLMTSEFLATKDACLRCIRMVKRAAAHEDNFIRWDIDKHCFNLHYGDDSLMIGAMKYKSAEARDLAIATSRLAIIEAPVEDYTTSMRQAA